MSCSLPSLEELGFETEIDQLHYSNCICCVCLAGTRKSFDHLISDSKAPKRPEMESGMTTPPKMRRVAENDYEIGESTILAFPSTSLFVEIFNVNPPCINYRDTTNWKLSPTQGVRIRVQRSAG